MSVCSWLVVDEWNKTSGVLEVGAEVTVDGERAGEARMAGSYWAQVTGSHGATYTVSTAAGKVVSNVSRAALRHRVTKTKAFVGVTGDRQR